MKKLTAWVGTLVLIMLVVGCSSTPKPNSESSEPGTVTPIQPVPEKPTEPEQPQVKPPETNAAEEPQKPSDPYELTHFTGEFKSYKASDKVPKLYRSEQYNIKKWELRKLPAPVAGSHWTYFGGAYVEITDSEGVIGRIYSGDNIYR